MSDLDDLASAVRAVATTSPQGRLKRRVTASGALVGAAVCVGVPTLIEWWIYGVLYPTWIQSPLVRLLAVFICIAGVARLLPLFGASLASVLFVAFCAMYGDTGSLAVGLPFMITISSFLIVALYAAFGSRRDRKSRSRDASNAPSPTPTGGMFRRLFRTVAVVFLLCLTTAVIVWPGSRTPKTSPVIRKQETPEEVTRQLMMAMFRHDREGVLKRIVPNPDAHLLWESAEHISENEAVELFSTLPVEPLRPGDPLPDPCTPGQVVRPEMVGSGRLVLSIRTKGAGAWVFFLIRTPDGWRVDMGWWLEFITRTRRKQAA